MSHGRVVARRLQGVPVTAPGAVTRCQGRRSLRGTASRRCVHTPGCSGRSRRRSRPRRTVPCRRRSKSCSARRTWFASRPPESRGHPACRRAARAWQWTGSPTRPDSPWVGRVATHEIPEQASSRDVAFGSQRGFVSAVEGRAHCDTAWPAAEVLGR